MRNRAGNYVQVKSGRAEIDESQIRIPDEVDVFFVFYPTVAAEETSGVDHRIRRITTDRLMAFVRLHRTIMPKFVQFLLE